MRKPKFTRALSKEIIDHVRKGIPLDVAAPAFGISESILDDWRRRAKEEPTGLHARFFGEVEKADVACRVRLLTTIVSAARRGEKKARKWLSGLSSEGDLACLLAVAEEALPSTIQAFHAKLKKHAATLDVERRLEEFEVIIATGKRH
ncbi:MAG: hypothetical protein EOP84_01625 [Verrucomicrobiaceae bacterium]|nr:MAG: hypothetical protein EOP84_01625 [Verrucomicrobiaceae bacterium]